MKRLMLAMLAVLALSGCWFLPDPIQVVKHPDTPMLVEEARRGKLRVAVYDAAENRLIEYGWIAADDVNLKGWTITKYDWEAFIAKRKGQ